MMKYQKEHIAFIKTHSSKMTRDELARRFNARFGTNQSVTALQRYCNRHKIKGLPSGQFKKGHTAWNKGKPFPKAREIALKTGFKKGHTPSFTCPVGTERMRYGYMEVKVAMPNIWRHKNVVVYEAHHGALPKGYIVRFLDGDKTNFDPNNLIAVSVKANMIINSRTTGLKELIKDRLSHEVVINIATLRTLISENVATKR